MKSLVFESHGSYVAGEKNGTWEFYYDFGALKRKDSFKKNRMHGKSVMYYPNQKVMVKSVYSKGKPSGNWLFYNERGDLVNEKKY